MTSAPLVAVELDAHVPVSACDAMLDAIRSSILMPWPAVLFQMSNRLVPFVFVMVNSLMPPDQVFSSHLVPRSIEWSNYGNVFKLFDVALFAGNTMLYAGLSTIGIERSTILTWA